MSMPGIITFIFLGRGFASTLAVNGVNFSGDDANDVDSYAYKCWAANRSFSDDKACNCLNKSRSADFDERPIIKILSPDTGWYRPPARYPSLSSYSALYRLGGSVDAFLLKIVLEEMIGFPAQLVSINVLRSCDKCHVYEALASGDAHLYPEAWLSEDDIDDGYGSWYSNYTVKTATTFPHVRPSPQSL